MLFWKKEAPPTVDLSWLGTDMHSHLLPGIDDGAQDPDTSLELVSGMMDLGFKQLVTTPHVLWEVYPNTRERIEQKRDLLNAHLANNGKDIQVQAAAEYFIDEHFEGLLKTKAPLLTIKQNMVLVEFSMITQPMDLKQILFEMQMGGYQPIIAHPERYIYLRDKKTFFDELKEIGCFFQLNLLSLVGYYGTTQKELAEYLVKKKYYNFAGTDLHNKKHLAALNLLVQSRAYNKLKEANLLKNYIL